jgi:hypothetical protein
MAETTEYDIHLFTGAGKSGLRIGNSPNEQQRSTLAQYDSRRIIKARLIDAIHGYLIPGSPRSWNIQEITGNSGSS